MRVHGRQVRGAWVAGAILIIIAVHLGLFGWIARLIDR